MNTPTQEELLCRIRDLELELQIVKDEKAKIENEKAKIENEKAKIEKEFEEFKAAHAITVDHLKQALRIKPERKRSGKFRRQLFQLPGNIAYGRKSQVYFHAQPQRINLPPVRRCYRNVYWKVFSARAVMKWLAHKTMAAHLIGHNSVGDASQLQFTEQATRHYAQAKFPIYKPHHVHAKPLAARQAPPGWPRSRALMQQAANQSPR